MQEGLRIGGIVLIETYWNVKPGAHVVTWPGSYVLIETYWNVKLLYTTVVLFTTGINRNILECKGIPGVIASKDFSY